MAEEFDIVPAGDAALVVRFADRIDAAVNARAIAAAEALRRASVPGVLDVVPTFRSVGVYFDPVRTNHDDLLSALRHLSALEEPAQAQTGATFEVPVTYGGDDGPDLAEVARFAHTTAGEVVRLHCARVYRVFMLGFLPGFAYMGTVDERIAVPRRQTPRSRVAAGSVGIAGSQTGVYPRDTPGGWQIIGRSELSLFDTSRAEASLLRAGDLVRFVAVEPGR